MTSSAVLASKFFVTTRSQMPCDETGRIGYLLPTKRRPTSKFTCTMMAQTLTFPTQLFFLLAKPRPLRVVPHLSAAGTSLSKN